MSLDHPVPSGPRSERSAAEELAALHRWLLRSVRSRWRGADAEDVVQEAFLRLWRAEGRTLVRNRAALLMIITTNLIRDRIRTEAVQRDCVRDMAWLNPLPHDAPDPERTVAARQQLAAIDAAIADLPDSTRTAFMLHRLQDLPQADIADHLHISVSMVEKHVRRAVRRCRTSLEASDTPPDRPARPVRIAG